MRETLIPSCPWPVEMSRTSQTHHLWIQSHQITTNKSRQIQNQLPREVFPEKMCNGGLPKTEIGNRKLGHRKSIRCPLWCCRGCLSGAFPTQKKERSGSKKRDHRKHMQTLTKETKVRIVISNAFPMGLRRLDRSPRTTDKLHGA